MWKACSSSRFHEKQLRYGSKSSFFGKICLYAGVNHQFSGKLVQMRGAINEKQKKKLS